MCLSLNKLLSKYGKRIILIFYIHCIKLEESQNHHFPIYSYPFFLSFSYEFLHSLFKHVCFEKKKLPISAQNINVTCDSQLIVTAPFQAVKLPSTVVTRLPFCFSLFTFIKVYLCQTKKIQKSNFFNIYQVTLIQWVSCFPVTVSRLGSITCLYPLLYCDQINCKSLQ